MPGALRLWEREGWFGWRAGAPITSNCPAVNTMGTVVWPRNCITRGSCRSSHPGVWAAGRLRVQGGGHAAGGPRRHQRQRKRPQVIPEQRVLMMTRPWASRSYATVHDSAEPFDAVFLAPAHDVPCRGLHRLRRA